MVACAKVVAPTISDPLCQEQLMEAAKDVAKSVEGCVTTCKDVSRDEPSLRELGSSAQDVTRALNDLLNHVKDGHTDRIPDIMEQIMVASGELIGSYDSGEMVRQARILAQSTAELIQAIKGEAETQSDSDLQVGCFSSRVNHIVILLILFGVVNSELLKLAYRLILSNYRPLRLMTAAASSGNMLNSLSITLTIR